jgi:hypothetical protein
MATTPLTRPTRLASHWWQAASSASALIRRNTRAKVSCEAMPLGSFKKVANHACRDCKIPICYLIDSCLLPYSLGYSLIFHFKID